jgi:hypothetical protein
MLTQSGQATGFTIHAARGFIRGKIIATNLKKPLQWFQAVKTV